MRFLRLQPGSHSTLDRGQFLRNPAMRGFLYIIPVSDTLKFGNFGENFRKVSGLDCGNSRFWGDDWRRPVRSPLRGETAGVDRPHWHESYRPMRSQAGLGLLTNCSRLAGIRARLRELASVRRRFGYRRLLLLIRSEGVLINHKKLRRLTPEIWVEPLGHGVEARWPAGQMPLAYRFAPLVIDNSGNSDIRLLARESRGVSRSTPISRFASAFRSRRLPLAGAVGAAVIACYRKWRTGNRVAKTYAEAMPNPPPMIELDRKKRYQAIRKSRRVSVGCRARRRRACARRGPATSVVEDAR